MTSKPHFIDSKNFDYAMKALSPGLRHPKRYFGNSTAPKTMPNRLHPKARIPFNK